MSEETTYWYAIKTRRDFQAESVLAAECEEVFFPKEEVVNTSGKKYIRALIPHVLFIRTGSQRALSLEERARDPNDRMIPFWIYRYEKSGAIQPIPEQQIALLKLLSGNDGEGCEILHNTNLRKGQYVRVIGGLYKGYEGYISRIRKNRHVIVRLEGICLVVLPYIHPDLLEVVPAPTSSNSESIITST